MASTWNTMGCVFLVAVVAAGAEPAAPLLDVRPLSIIRPPGESGWQADASAVFRGDLETAPPGAAAVRSLVDRLSEAAAAGEARALSALGMVQLYGVVDSARELELAPFHPLFNALRRFEHPPTLRPNVTAAVTLLRKAAQLGEPSALATLGVLLSSNALADAYGDDAAALLPPDARASTQLLSLAATAGDPVAASIMGLRASAEGECEAAAAVFEMGARSTIERARTAGGSRALDNAMPNLARPTAARMRAGEVAELKAWADKVGKPPLRETNDAALTYAQLCVEGAHGLPRNLTLAHGYYERAAAAGEGGAHIALGLIQLATSAAAAEARRDGAAAGSAAGSDEDAAALRAAIEHLSIGIERAWGSVEKAMGWAALGQLALEGREGVVPRSDAVALRCYREAAATGYLEGFFNLAAMHYAGRGVARDLDVASALLSEAASSGHLPSMHVLGAMARRGEGMPRDCERAAQLLRPVALRHEMVYGAEQAAVRSARRWDFQRALLRSEPLAMAGLPGAMRRTAEAYEGLAAIAEHRGEPARAARLRASALARYEQAAGLAPELGGEGSRAAMFAATRLWRREAGEKAADKPREAAALRESAASVYEELAAEGYDEASWQLLTMKARGELGPRLLKSVEAESARAVLRPLQPFVATTSSTMRYAALWATAAFVRWGRWALLWAALAAANTFVGRFVRPAVARDALLRVRREELATAAAGIGGGALSREGAPAVFEALDRALQEAGWDVRLAAARPA